VEDPGAVLPGLERVLFEPAGDGRGGGLADPPLDHEPVQLSAREARERDALRARQLAGDRLHLRDLFREENAAGDPTALDRRALAAARRRSAVASGRRPPAPSPGGGRSPRSSTPRPRTGPSSPAARPCAAACNRPPDARARPARQCSRRPGKGSVPASQHRFAASTATPSSSTELPAGSTKCLEAPKPGSASRTPTRPTGRVATNRIQCRTRA
jgi:hypothetical protein